jgi:hypothetical protein
LELDAQTKALLEEVNNSGSPQINELPVADARAGLREMSAAMTPRCVKWLNRKTRKFPDPKAKFLFVCIGHKTLLTPNYRFWFCTTVAGLRLGTPARMKIWPVIIVTTQISLLLT